MPNGGRVRRLLVASLLLVMTAGPGLASASSGPAPPAARCASQLSTQSKSNEQRNLAEVQPQPNGVAVSPGDPTIWGYHEAVSGLAWARCMGATSVPPEPPQPSSLTCDNSGYADLSAGCQVLHPGDLVVLPGAFHCTLNFLWRDDRGNRYFGTAGHCASAAGQGSVVFDGSERRAIGRVVYHVWDSQDEASDFALIRLDPHVAVSPVVRGWGGPTGIYDAMSASPLTFCFFGQGQVVGSAAPARHLYATAATQPNVIDVWGAVHLGDSGSPVVDVRGKAVGWLVTVADGSDTPVTVGSNGGYETGYERVTRIGPQVSAAENSMHQRLTLLHGNHSSCP
jgi:hypothetical protein